MSQNALYAEIRQIAVTSQLWQDVKRHTVKPDEQFDLFRVAGRVYGNNRFWFAVQAAAGLDSPENPLTVGDELVLPTFATLRRLYNKHDVDFNRG